MTDNTWLSQPAATPYEEPCTGCNDIFCPDVMAPAHQEWCASDALPMPGPNPEWATFERQAADDYCREIGADKPAAEQRERALRLAEGCPTIHWPPLLDEAERRGAENGWDEGHAAHDLAPDEWVNPYRKEA